MSEISLLLEYVKAREADVDRRFGDMDVKLDKIDANVQSLLESRSFRRGMTRAAKAVVGAVAAGVAGLVSLVVTWLLK